MCDSPRMRAMRHLSIHRMKMLRRKKFFEFLQFTFEEIIERARRKTPYPVGDGPQQFASRTPNQLRDAARKAARVRMTQCA